MARDARRAGGGGHRAGGVAGGAPAARQLRPRAAARAVAASDRRQPRDRLRASAERAARGRGAGAGGSARRAVAGTRRRHAGGARDARARAARRRRPAPPARLLAEPDRGAARAAARHGELAPAPGAGRAREGAGAVTDDLRDRFERAPLPGAEDARRRAWGVVRSAAPPAAARSRLRRWRVPVVALLAAAGAAVAFTPPGAAVGDWVRARVAAPKKAAEPVTERATRLPASGRLLVRDDRGVAVVSHDGRRTALGRYAGATWSPRGLFVAAWRGTRLVALTPAGAVRWQVTAPQPIRTARWSLEPGFRVAYVTSGGQLRIVNGDGTGHEPDMCSPTRLRPAVSRSATSTPAR